MLNFDVRMETDTFRQYNSKLSPKFSMTQKNAYLISKMNVLCEYYTVIRVECY